MRRKPTPLDQYAELFVAVQSSGVFNDSKSFVDAIARAEPGRILDRYRRESATPGFDLAHFVADCFELPADPIVDVTPDPARPVRAYIDALWDVLTREDKQQEATGRSSLLPLPHPYIVPGGRFRESYYWDSYFTMLGLAAAGRLRPISSMVANFAGLIDTVGFVPNGNRSYFCSRSQPPFFALMVELLAELGDAARVYRRYLPQLEKEYAFWMGRRAGIEGGRAVTVDADVLNRYWDDDPSPRQESYAEDLTLAAGTRRDDRGLYRDLRAACESGWDFSSRWLADGADLTTIRTTRILPVDLNALLHRLEAVLADAHRVSGHAAQSQAYRRRAATRRDLIRTLFWSDSEDSFVDLLLPDLEQSRAISLAAACPLFLGIADDAQAARVAARLAEDFLKPGGWVTTLSASGEQWDTPNGWAPLQWICYAGLERYGHARTAEDGALRWVENNLRVYRDTGRLLEKYNVCDVGAPAVGGEYEVQDGFGWTNGVLLRLMDELGVTGGSAAHGGDSAR